MQPSSGRALHTVIGPERLLVPVHRDSLERMSARVTAGEGDVAARVPVLGRDIERERIVLQQLGVPAR